jgi:hypothetical protein
LSPAGWFDPWMFEWQFTQLRPTTRLLAAASCVPS